MLQQFQDHIARHRLCKTTDKILVAVSGGIDSMVLLQLFIQAGYPVSAAHCNFQLRGAESDEDEQFVIACCKKIGVPMFTKRFDTTSFVTETGLSVQMAARELRYQWFQGLLEKEKLDKIATAHHLNDSLETVLLRLAHGTGMEGLEGIPVINGKIIRPLLFATRSEIENYAAEMEISWRDDASNAIDHYQRNFIRLQVFPKLKELNPSLEISFSHSLEKIKGAMELMKTGIENFESLFVTRSKDQTRILKIGLEKFHHPVPVLWELTRKFGFNLEQCREIWSAKNGQPGKKFLSNMHQLVVDREHFIIAILSQDWDSTELEADQPEATLGPWRLTKQKAAPVITQDKSEALFDEERLKFPLRWRKWKPGDSFVPLGMKGRKKVSDFLIDQKISVTDKQKVTVLESGGEVAWVVGHRMDDRFKITPSTKSAVVFRFAQL